MSHVGSAPPLEPIVTSRSFVSSAERMPDVPEVTVTLFGVRKKCESP
jgi:hypothetical protein